MNRTDISALRKGLHHEDDDLEQTVRDGSTDNIVQTAGVELTPMGKVYQHTTIEITSEPAFDNGVEESSDRSSKDSDRHHGRINDSSARMWGR